MDYETIIAEKTDGIGIITLNRPEKINSISPQMTAELGEAITDFGDDDDVLLQLKSMVKGKLPDSPDDFQKNKWFEE